ncbi:MAG: malonyl-[acyl-carrier protein] O-methyltransferase BioC [Chromatiales bacterium]|jgi:malonyl-CoA O-methyltransferase|nr:malonyl-[acyl-carrier protein] O-methyltransferase BioC [Chromatiales bacterium]MDP7093359.1 methyltransferase domain-containing protein [Gammaproteobacteria bacterium]MDP7271035.1 methyltransferase domain-containing protein [Gammaproteobacteria bacterium]HJP04179.1 methyltransferase domain-containing protein [Gammaproteobacteria bacterium]
MHALNQQQLRTAQGKVAAGYDAADFFCAEIRARLLERLGLISLVPQTVLELGAGTGAAAAEIRHIYPETALIQLDWSFPMLRSAAGITGSLVCADGHRLPLTDRSVDMALSNMMLPYCADPERVFHETRRVLKAPGLFLFSTLGPDSLRELRRAWAKVDDHVHVHEFADMHNIGDALIKAGFSEPVMDVEMLTVTYTDIGRLVADLRGTAATNFCQQRSRGLTTPARWQQMRRELEASRDTEGRWNLSLEVIYGQAWAGEPGTGISMEDGEARFPLSRLSSLSRPN